VSIISAYLAKLLKDRGLFSGRNTDTGVADRDLSTIVYLVGCDADSPSLRSELHGIGKKIQKNLLDLSLITDVFTKPLVHVNVQRNAVLRIGVLTPDPISARLYQFEAFKEGFRGLGYVEGQNIAFEIRSADGKRDRLAGLATELVSFKADVILTSTTTSKLGLFQKHGVNMELIAFPGGTVGLQALLAGDIQFATEDGLAGLQANLRGANLQFLAGMINSFPFLILSKPEIRVPAICVEKKSPSAGMALLPTRRCAPSWKDTNCVRTRTLLSCRAEVRRSGLQHFEPEPWTPPSSARPLISRDGPSALTR